MTETEQLGLIASIDARLDAELQAAVQGLDLGVEGEYGEEANVYLSPTVLRFVRSDKQVNLLYGPRREGKTVGGVARLIRIAQEYPEAQPVPVAVVRDTWTNLQRTTIKTLKQGQKMGWWDVTFLHDETEAVLNDGEVHLYFFGMDRPADANKFQGFEAAILWIEEPAPAADLASGVPADVFGIGATSLSHRGCPTSVQITMNPPDEDHWTVRMTEELIERDLAYMQVETFWIEPGENRHLPAGYREQMRVALELAGRFDLVKRLVEGKVFGVVDGVAVTPEFVAKGPESETHVIPSVPIRAGWPSFRFWDFGLFPSVVFMQISPSGHLLFPGCLVADNKGITEFIPETVIPWMGRFKMIGPPKTQVNVWGKVQRGGWEWRDIGDCSGKARDPIDSKTTVAKALERMLNTRFEPGPPEWSDRRESIHWVLNQRRSGRRMVQMDEQECKPLIAALSGKWRYHKSSSGIVSRIPIKDIHSHPGDAFGHGMSVLFPAQELRQAAGLLPQEPPPALPPPKGSWLGA